MMETEIRKLSLKKGDILIVERSFVDAHQWMKALSSAAKTAGVDFEIPVLFVDDIDSIKIIRHDGDRNG